MRSGLIRVVGVLGAGTLLVVATPGCGSAEVDAAALLAKGISQERSIAAEVASASGTLKDGTIPDPTRLDSMEADLESAKAELNEAVDGGGLTPDQQQQASVAQQSAQGAEGEISTDQAVAQDAPTVAQGDQQQELEQKFAERAESLICKKLREAAGSEPTPEPTEGEEASEVERELGVELSAAQAITTDVRTVANHALQEVNNVIHLNPAGQAAIIEATLNHFACSAAG